MAFGGELVEINLQIQTPAFDAVAIQSEALKRRMRRDEKARLDSIAEMERELAHEKDPDERANIRRTLQELRENKPLQLTPAELKLQNTFGDSFGESEDDLTREASDIHGASQKYVLKISREAEAETKVLVRRLPLLLQCPNYVWDAAVEVIGNGDQTVAVEWLIHRDVNLHATLTPIEVAVRGDPVEVMQRLGRIEYGVFS